MASDESFARLLTQLRAGDNDATALLLRRLAGRLHALARRRLPRAIAGRTDAEDVLASALRTFFRRLRDDQFTIRDWDDLAGLLARITARKCARRVVRARAECRDVAREESLVEVSARDPAPDRAAQFNDLLAELARSLSALDARVLALRLMEHTVAEISEQVGTSQRTVKRSLERLRGRLRRMLPEEELPRGHRGRHDG